MTLAIQTPAGPSPWTDAQKTELREEIGAITAAEAAAGAAGAASAAAAGAVGAHTQAADPHPGRYAADAHTHAGLMTPAERDQLASLPTGDALAQQMAAKAALIGGKLDPSQLPDIAVIDYLGAVASQAEMLALVGQRGDWCSRTDTGTVYIITGANPAVIGGWTQLAYPAAAVQSVCGLVGVITVAQLGAALANLFASAAQGAKADSALQPGAQPAGVTILAEQVQDSGAAGREILRKGTMPEIQALVSGAPVLRLSATDAAGNTAIILANPIARIPPGAWPVNPISSTVKLILDGFGRRESVLFSTADAAGALIASTARMELRNLGIAGISNTAKGPLTTSTGVQDGVRMSSVNDSHMSGCAVFGFGGAALKLYGNTLANSIGSNVIGNSFQNSGVGIDTGDGNTSAGGGEYCKIISNTFIENIYGAIVRSGNVNMSGANEFQYNGENIWVVGSANNGAHGTIVGNHINHAYRVSLRVEDVVSGHVITNNTIFGAGTSILMSNSRGVKLDDNLMLVGAINFSGIEWNSFKNNTFYGVVPSIIDTSGTVWIDNFQMPDKLYTGNRQSFSANSKLVYTPGMAYVGGNICPNGDFASPAGWTAQAGWSISGGVATANTSNALLFRALAGALANTTYQVTFDCTVNSGQIAFGIGGHSQSAQITTSGAKSVEFSTGPASDGNLYFVGGNFTGTLDNITVTKKINSGDLSTTNIGATNALYVGSTKYFSGEGSPEGVITAIKGDEYTRTDGTAGTYVAPGTLKYIKTSGAGNTGWVAVL